MKKYTIALLWLGTGLLSWSLTIYLFHFLVSPLLMDGVRAVNAGDHPVLLKHAANLLFAHLAAFILSFVFALALSLYSEATPSRLALFVVGAAGIAVYLQFHSVWVYWRQYAEIPSWAAVSIVQGLISALLLVPLMSFLGSKAGTFLRSRAKR